MRGAAKKTVQKGEKALTRWKKRGLFHVGHTPDGVKGL
jgi:hypothetical protein